MQNRPVKQMSLSGHYPPVARAPRVKAIPMLTCGCLGIFGVCLVVAVIGVVVLLPNLPGIAAQVVGFTPNGSVESVFVNPPPPAPELQNPVVVDQAIVNLGVYGEQAINNAPTLYNFTIGTAAGVEAASITFTESGLMDLCRQRTTICLNQNPTYQNVAVDLRPGGLIAYADATLPQLGGLTQRLGVVLQVDATGRRLVFVGLDINGSLFSNPPVELSTLIAQLEQDANTILTGLSVEMSGSQYSLSRITIDDTMAVLFLQ